jgi:hypothetical protein
MKGAPEKALSALCTNLNSYKCLVVTKSKNSKHAQVLVFWLFAGEGGRAGAIFLFYFYFLKFGI